MSPMKQSVHLIVVVFVLIAAMAGCAPVMEKTDYSLRSPAYPEVPRIAYLKSYYGGGNVEYSSFIEKILGSSASEKMGRPIQPVWLKDTLYVTMQGDNAIGVVDTKTMKFTVINHFGNEKFKGVLGLAVSSAGEIYLCDPVANRIYVGDLTGSLKRTIGEAQKISCSGLIALDEQRGRLYVVDRPSNTVKAIKTSGERLFEFGEQGSQDGQFNQPFGIAVDKRNGRIVIVDSMNYRIQVFDDQGKFIRKFGENHDGPNGFSGARGVAVDSEGHIYVSDALSHRMSIFNDEGEVLMNFGAPGSNPGFFQLPNGISFDERDRLYVADGYNGRVQVFQYLSEQWKQEHPEEYAKYNEKPVFNVNEKKEKNLPLTPLTH